MSKLKIAQVVPSLSNKGPVIVAKDLVEVFVSKGHECEVFYFDNITELDFCCKTNKISFWNSFNFEDFDIVHLHTFRPSIYGTFQRLISTRKKVKFISTIHQPIKYNTFRLTKGRFLSAFYSFFSIAAYNNLDKNIVLSSYQKQLCNGLINNSKIEVIKNGRDVRNVKETKIDSDISTLKSLKNKYKIIGSISVVIKRKGLEQIIKSLVTLKDWAFVCVGDGDELEKLKDLSVQLKVDKRCLWLGYMKNAHVFNNFFNVFVIPSRSEGFPLAFIEAAAYGIPTVMSDIPILKSIARNEEVAFFKLDNIKSLCESIRMANQNSHKYSKKLRKYYNSELTASAMAERYLDLYSKIL